MKSFESVASMLEECEKELQDYANAKRTDFPRFFFLSDDQMLEILSQTKNVLAVQPHLNKSFEGINRIRFEENLDITGMVSAEGEEVAFLSKVATMQCICTNTSSPCHMLRK